MEDYTVDYYRSINEIERPQAEALAKSIVWFFNPQSVADVGCGTGLYASMFPSTVLVTGFEYSYAAMDDQVRQLSQDELYSFDLREDNNSGAKFDVALCLEVLEHIGAEFADKIVTNLATFSDTLIVTAAPPGQAGLNHVNCQPQPYWNEKFAALGYQRDYHAEYQLLLPVMEVPHTLWLIRNLMVFKR